MGLFGAIDDIGLTAGPALAAVGLAVVSPATLMGVNAVTFAISAVLIATVATRGAAAESPRATTTLFADARAGVRELAVAPGDPRRCSAPRPASCFCIGITNVGEVVLAREVLHVGGSGLAVMVAAGGLGTVLGSLCTRFTTAGAWAWRRAYVIGVGALAVELFACALAALLLARSSRRSRSAASATASRSSTTACCSSRSTPASLHGRLFGLQKTCVSFAFALVLPRRAAR